jgi:hypothetical protein
MKFWIVAAIVVLVGSASAQYKSTGTSAMTGVSSSVMRPSDGLLFGWLDPSRLSMRHSYTLSYSSFGGRGLSMGMYTNSLAYRFSDPLDVQFDVSVLHSPFGVPGGMGDFGGIYLTRAQLNYRPTDNMWLQIQFRRLPPMYWWGSGYTSDFFDRTHPSGAEDR